MINLCKFGLHSFTDWKQYMYGARFKRVCKKCGKEQIQDYNNFR